jgi:RNA polymerase sigma-54 factor
MALLQPKLSLKVAQRQVLTPGLMQMVSVLALNKLELKEMINTEIVENPVLEELDESVPLLDDMQGREAERDRPAEETPVAEPEKDPFDEIDFGSYFQDYLDPGYRTQSNYEELDKPSFENFLAQPSTLTDHLLWQLGSLNLPAAIRGAAEFIIGNLNEDGYLTASEEDLIQGVLSENSALWEEVDHDLYPGFSQIGRVEIAPNGNLPTSTSPNGHAHQVFRAALAVVQNLDPLGIATRDLRECLLVQIAAQQREFELLFERRRRAVEEEDLNVAVPTEQEMQEQEARRNLFSTAHRIVDCHLALLQRRDLREIAKVAGCSPEVVQQALDYIRTLDPRPGQRYNRIEARLIEPDVAFVKRDDVYVVVMNEEDLPTLRLNQRYRRLLSQGDTTKDVKDYVKERYRSALQLMRNIEQRKNTILRTCESIVRRQQEFLELGMDALKPMMIKEVAEEIGVHPSTVSRAVSNKYVHTPQGVFELRFFFSEGVNGPEGAGTPLLLLKRKVKRLIEEEDPRKPLTDDQIAAFLQSQGISVTRRTVAKYREDMNIPSTHQRRKRD